MGKEFHFTLEGFDIGQILDGLRCRQESWANTAIYLRDDYFPNESFLCEECSDSDEAPAFARGYGAAGRRSRIIISESLARSNGRSTIRAAGRCSRGQRAEGRGQRSEVRNGRNYFGVPPCIVSGL